MSIKAQMEKIIRKQDLRLKAIAEKVMDETRETLIKILNNDLYGNYTPKDYERSYALIEAVDGKIVKNGAGDYTIEVFFDESRIHPRSRVRSWNQHMGFDGESFTHSLIMSFEKGVGGAVTNPRRGEKIEMISKTQEEAQKTAERLLKNYIK